MRLINWHNYYRDDDIINVTEMMLDYGYCGYYDDIDIDSVQYFIETYVWPDQD
jgi:hypothetical protein